MDIKKELNIKEILKEIKTLKYRLLNLKEKLKIGFFEIKAVTWKDVITKSSFKGDIMLSKMIKADGTREEFDAVKQSYESFNTLLAEKIGEMLETKPIGESIKYLKDTLRWKWDDISKLVNFSISHCKRLKKEYENTK